MEWIEIAAFASAAARSAPRIISVKKAFRLSGKYREKW
jgi:hypothetical protein